MRGSWNVRELLFAGCNVCGIGSVLECGSVYDQQSVGIAVWELVL